MKPGDKVWVLCEVVEDPCHGKVKVKYCSLSFWPYLFDCKPIEPEAVEQSTKRELTEAQKLAERTLKAIWAANDEINEPPVAKQSLTPDPVNSPKHYDRGIVECIEAIQGALVEGFSEYLRGNIIKYLWRYKEKNGIEDLKKARWYLDRLIQEEEAK